MFEQSVIPRGEGRRGWIFAAVMVGQLLAVGVLILIPLFYLQVLPAPELVSMLVAPPPPPPPPPPPAPAAHVAHVPRTVVRTFDANRLIEPRTIPKQIATVQDLPQAVPTGGVIGGIPGGVPGGQVGGVVGGILGAVPAIAPPPPPPPPEPAPQAAPKPAPSGPIRVGGEVEAARLISSPQPVYPQLAAEAHIGGMVVLSAIIGKDGHVKDVTVVSGSPLLVHSAMNAVKQWVYRPTYLNGKPVDVSTEVDVHFQLT